MAVGRHPLTMKLKIKSHHEGTKDAKKVKKNRFLSSGLSFVLFVPSW
jgi:hypothetical protein